jgi:fumarylacetoacetate (FAA) hydrolase
MRLATYRIGDHRTFAGVLRGDQMLMLPYPTLLELLRDPSGLDMARAILAGARESSARAVQDISLLAPIPEPPTIRDFYAFEQHVKTARARRGLGMVAEWYEFPTFYFSNTSEIYGPDAAIPYPRDTHELDFELEIACVIGRAGRDIPVEQAANYIAGYTIMNDWSARDLQRKDMLLLGPAKGKDFATSLGPWLVTPDELAPYRLDSAAQERYNLTMCACINGQEVTHGNLQDIYYSFAQMIAWASRNVRLRPGDVLGSGTVGGGCILERGSDALPWLQRRDTVELEITGLGLLRNTIV